VTAVVLGVVVVLGYGAGLVALRMVLTHRLEAAKARGQALDELAARLSRLEASRLR
jgi:hypothetical protein